MTTRKKRCVRQWRWRDVLACTGENYKAVSRHFPNGKSLEKTLYEPWQKLQKKHWKNFKMLVSIRFLKKLCRLLGLQKCGCLMPAAIRPVFWVAFNRPCGQCLHGFPASFQCCLMPISITSHCRTCLYTTQSAWWCPLLRVTTMKMPPSLSLD